MGTSSSRWYRIDGKRRQIFLGWVCVSFGVGVIASPSAADEPAFKGDVELFRVLAMAQRDNTERISSWQGSSRVQVTRADPNAMLLRETGVFDFVHAREHNATRWHWTPEERYRREGGELVAKPEEDLKLSEMRKSDAFYKYDLATKTREGERRGALVIWPVDKAEEGVYSYSFDPMWYLSGEMAGRDNMAAELMKYYRMANDPNFTNTFARYSLTRDGPLVTLDIENQTADMANRFVFDLSKGGTLTSYHGTKKRDVQSMKLTYDEKDGVWIPRTCTKNIEWDPPHFEGCTKYTRTVTFVESTLNDPVPASEFSLDKLGLQMGDKVSDHKLGTRYLYGGLSAEATLQSVNLPADKLPTESQSDAQGEDDDTMPNHSPVGGASSGDVGSDQENAQPGMTKAAQRSLVWPIVLLAVGGMGFILLRRRWKARAES